MDRATRRRLRLTSFVQRNLGGAAVRRAAQARDAARQALGAVPSIERVVERVMAEMTSEAMQNSLRGEPGKSPVIPEQAVRDAVQQQMLLLPRPPPGKPGLGIASARFELKGDGWHMIFIREDGREIDAGIVPFPKQESPQSWVRLRQKGSDTIIQGGDNAAVRLTATSTTFQTTDEVLLVDTTGGDRTITLNPAAAYFDSANQRSLAMSIKKVNFGGGDVIIQPNGAELFDLVSPATIQGSSYLPGVSFISDGSNFWVAL